MSCLARGVWIETQSWIVDFPHCIVRTYEVTIWDMAALKNLPFHRASFFHIEPDENDSVLGRKKVV